KISDMGLSKQLGRDDHSFSSMSFSMSMALSAQVELQKRRAGQGGDAKRTLTVDVFSLGCVFYFAASLGEHPFGEWFEREANIIAGKADLSLVAHDPSALDLVCWMLHPDPLQRPTSREVCTHAFFWSHGKRLEFLVEFSDRLEREEPDAAIVLAVETGAAGVIGTRWDRRLDALLLEDMGRYRKYDACSLRDLLRVIRNKRHHFHELSAELKGAMGALPHGFLHYFDVRFPQLVLHCADVASVYLAGEPLFAAFVHSTSA
ncbi:endoribonuclease/protein kinase IRE1, partial [Ochromonadaceae sp. CCMP2298]